MHPCLSRLVRVVPQEVLRGHEADERFFRHDRQPGDVVVEQEPGRLLDRGVGAHGPRLGPHDVGGRPAQRLFAGGLVVGEKRTKGPQDVVVVDDAAKRLVRPDHEELPVVVLVEATANGRERRVRIDGHDIAAHDGIDGHGREGVREREDAPSPKRIGAADVHRSPDGRPRAMNRPRT